MPRSATRQSRESELVVAIQMLTEELRVLRDAVDELREAVQWGHHNHDGESQLPTGHRIQSSSLDLTSPNFSVNTLDQETIETLRAGLTAIRDDPGKQGELFT